MPKIGLISDTHGFLDPGYQEFFKDCDEIWHAGDIGSAEIVQALNRFKKTRIVFGNIDAPEVQHITKEWEYFECGGLWVYIIHIAGAVGKYNPQVRNFLKENKVDILVCGHSHILKVMQDKTYAPLLYMNPGAAGEHGFHHMKTVLTMTIENAKPSNLQVIELGKRGKINSSM